MYLALLRRSYLAILLTGCGYSEPAPAPPAARELSERRPEGVVVIQEASRRFLTVEVVQADRGSSVIQAPARVAFRDGALSEAGAPFSGRVMRVHVRSGDDVAREDPLVTLDSPDAASVRSALATATASLRQARATLERERRMLEQGVGTERDRLAAETRVSELEAELARALASAAFVGAGEGAALVVRAPIAGRVIRLNATLGMAVQQGSEPLVQIGDPTALWIVAEVFERDLPLVSEGARAVVEVPSLPGRRWWWRRSSRSPCSRRSSASSSSDFRPTSSPWAPSTSGSWSTAPS